MEKFLGYAQNFSIKIIYAAFIILAGIIAAKIVCLIIKNIFLKTRLSKEILLNKLISNFIYYAIIFLALMTALEKVGLSITPLIAGLGVSGLIIGFALKDSLANFAAGILLIIYRPFKAGDTVNISGVTGDIKEMTIVNTSIKSVEGPDVCIPNSRVWGNIITNFSKGKIRRHGFAVKVSSKNDMEKLKKTIMSAAEEDRRIVKKPACYIRTNEINANFISLTLFVHAEHSEFENLLNDFQEVLHKKLTAEDIAVM